MKTNNDYNYQKTCIYICIPITTLFMLVLLAMTDAKPLFEAIITVVMILLCIGVLSIASTAIACIVMEWIQKKSLWISVLMSILASCLACFLSLYTTNKY